MSIFQNFFLRSIVPIQSDPGFGNATQFYGVPISKDIKDSVRNLLLLRSTVSYNYLTIIHPFSCNFPLGLCDMFSSMPVVRLIFSTMPWSFMEDLSILLPSLTLIYFIYSLIRIFSFVFYTDDELSSMLLQLALLRFPEKAQMTNYDDHGCDVCNLKS